MKTILKLLPLMLSLVIFSCNDLSKEEIQEKKEILQVYEENKKNLESIDNELKNSIQIHAKVSDSLKLSDELMSQNLVPGENLKKLMKSKFIENEFRYDLMKVIGHSAKLISSTDKEQIYNVELFNYLNDSAKAEVKYPNENGILEEVKITSKMSAALNFFIGSASLENNEIFHSIISQTANIIIDENQINLEKIKREFPNSQSRQNVELITSVTVTEFMNKKYVKREKKIKVSQFPLIKSGVSLGSDFFTESSRLRRRFKVSIQTTPIEDIIQRIGNRS